MDNEKASKQLFEREPLAKAVIKLALPAVMGQIILVIYSLADTFFVALTDNDAMIAAVTVCMPAFMILSAIANLFGVGGASAMARAAGAGQRERAKQASCFALFGCICVAAIYSLLCTVFSDVLIDALGGAAQDVHTYAEEYLVFTVSIGGIATAFSTLMAHLLRAEGRSVQASVGIAIGGIANVILDPLFMFVLLENGCETLGAAAATMLSNVISAAYFIYVLIKNKNNTLIDIRPRIAAVPKDIAFDVLSVGAPACLMTLCENISFAVLDGIIAAYGTAMQAGLGVAKKVNMLAHCMARGMAQGILPLISYNFASGNHKRMKKAAFAAASVSVMLALGCTTVCLVFAKDLIGLFIHNGGASAEAGAHFLRILCIGGPFSAFAYMVISFFQATGHAARSLLLALMRKGIVDIPLMLLINSTIGFFGAAWATPAADIMCCIAAAILLALFMARINKGKRAENKT